MNKHTHTHTIKIHSSLIQTSKTIQRFHRPEKHCI